ncbi:retrovirus-related pol polyprotein from transposon TNT 1-94 [Tanacetum coccineum]
MMNEMVRNQLEVATMQVNVQFLQQLQLEWSRFVTIVKQTIDLDKESYHKLFEILKQYQKEVNEIRAEKIAKNANPLALVAAAQQYPDTYYQAPKPHRSYAPPAKTSPSTRSHATTRHKGKEIAKPITPPSESAFEEDSDPKQAQRDKEMQKNLALIAKYFKKIYKPTNNNIRTSSNSRNKNMDTTPRYVNENQTGQFANQRTVTVVGARETVGSQVVQQTVIQCFKCKEFRHFTKECRKPKRAKDFTYHKEKILLCKQAEKGVSLQAEQADWLEDTNKEIGEQEREAHYNFMAKIQEVLPAESGSDVEPLEKSVFSLCYLFRNPFSSTTMGNANPNGTLRDYFKPSHEGYMNTVELPVGNNVELIKRLPAGSITTWEDLTTRFLAQLFPPGRIAKLRNDILMFQQHYGESLSKAWTRLKELLHKKTIDYAAEGRLRKLSVEEAWATIKKLAQYEDKGWNDPVEPEEGSLNHENLDIEQLLGVMKYKVDALMKDVISLIGRRDIIYWEFLARQNLNQAFFDSISTDPFSRPQWGNLFRVNEPIYRELVREFFSSFKFEASAYKVSLYIERRSRDNVTLNGLSRAEIVKVNHLLMKFWPTIGDSGFNVGNTRVASIRDPRVKLAHRCIATTIAERKETTHRVTKIDLYYLYCIYTLEVICNIPYWLSKYLKGVRDKNLIYGGMFVTRIARSFGLLTNKIRDALSIEPPPHVFKKKTLISIGVIMELQNGICVWPTTQAVEEEDKVEEEARGDASNEGASGSANMYRNIS